MEKHYLVLAYYHFVEIENPQKEIAHWKRFLKEKDAKGRIYISEEGINGQMSLHENDWAAFKEWIYDNSLFEKMEIKIHRYPEHAFAKMTVKYRKQIVALDQKVDMTKQGEHVPPKKWKEMLENRDENTVIIDVRNDYEWKVGHFEGAEKPDLETFREFPEYAESLKEKYDPEKTKVMMYCTGGIRCELYSALMVEKGFKDVFQLEGGVIKYGLEEGNEHWKGGLFVFDDRLIVPISEEEEHEVIGTCHYCDCGCEVYYNCANMDCNELFLCCTACAEAHKGCCSKVCIDAPRRRECHVSDHPKPYRKLPYEDKLQFKK